MALDWIFGKPSVRQSEYLQFGSSYVISISDVQDIVDAIRALHLEVSIVRAQMVVGQFEATPHRIDLSRASDVDLGAVIISSLEAPPAVVDRCRVEVRLGSRQPAQCRITGEPGTSSTTIDPLFTRIEQIVTGGRRRVPPRKWAQLAKVAVATLLFAAWLTFSWSMWPNIAASLIAAAATISFGWQLQPRSADWWARLRKGGGGYGGHIAIDATPREQIRINRGERRANWKVATASSVATLIITVVGIWLTQQFG